jgi:hypothetical protein
MHLKSYCLQIAILVAAAASAHAECDCAQISGKRLFQCSDAVFIGQTTEDAGPFAAQITVKKVFKGRVQHDVVVAGVDGDCGYSVSFEPHRDYLFHARRGEGASGGLLELWRISICAPPLPAGEARVGVLITDLRRRAWWWKLPLSGWCRR